MIFESAAKDVQVSFPVFVTTEHKDTFDERLFATERWEYCIPFILRELDPLNAVLC